MEDKNKLTKKQLGFMPWSLSVDKHPSDQLSSEE